MVSSSPGFLTTPSIGDQKGHWWLSSLHLSSAEVTALPPWLICVVLGLNWVFLCAREYSIKQCPTPHYKDLCSLFGQHKVSQSFVPSFLNTWKTPEKWVVIFLDNVGNDLEFWRVLMSHKMCCVDTLNCKMAQGESFPWDKVIQKSVPFIIFL